MIFGPKYTLEEGPDADQTADEVVGLLGQSSETVKVQPKTTEWLPLVRCIPSTSFLHSHWVQLFPADPQKALNCHLLHILHMRF